MHQPQSIEKATNKNKQFHIDRVDYVPTIQRCWFCQRELKSRIAFYVRDEEGKELISGPTCVFTRARINPKMAVFPDFTKSSPDGPDDGGAKASTSTGKGKAKKEGYEEIEYLVLRYRKLSDFPAMKLKTLDPMYERYIKTGSITEDDRKHLAALIRKVRAERPEYSPDNLSACYAYSLWIKNALKELPPGKHDFLQAMLMQVYKKMYLSPAQAAGVNKWLSRIPGVPTLDPNAFKQAAPTAQ